MMNVKRSRLWSLIPIIIVGLLCSALLRDRYVDQVGGGRVWLSSRVAQTVESWWYDFKMKYRTARLAAPVTVASIDDASLERFGRWPWSRGVFAELVETLYEAGAKSVVFDVVFSEPEYQSRELEKTLQIPVPGRNQSIQKMLKLRVDQTKELATWLPEIGDQYLGQSIWRHADKTVLGYFWKTAKECQIMDDSSVSADNMAALGYLPYQTWKSHVELIVKHGFRLAEVKDFLTHKFLSGGLGPLQLCPTINRGAVGSLAQRQGFFNAISDVDGVFRKSNLILPFLLNSGDREGLYVFPSLTLGAVMADLGADAISIDWHDYPRLQSKSIWIHKGERAWRIPVRSDGSILIDFAPRGGVKSGVPTVSLARAGYWSEQEKMRIRDKIVMIGPTSTGVFDLRPNPTDPHGAGVFLHAAATSQILEQIDSQKTYEGLVELSIGKQLALLWLFLIFLAVSLLYSRRALVAGIWWPAILVLAIGDLALFRSGFVSHFALISVAWSLTLAIVTLLLYLLEERDRIFIKKAFARYVSPEVVRQIEEDPKALNLYGERKEISVLFADIRRFTSVTETLSPDELRILLGDYFKPMTEIIQRQRGTVDKFIGDAIMALFGAPLPLASHAQAAVEAMHSMQLALCDLQRTDTRFADLKIGVAVASGWASVGNMGTDSIFTYTALGDVVNVASRLENLTKSYGVGVLIAETTFLALTPIEQQRWRVLDHVRVAGKLNAVMIYGICDDEMLRADYARAFGLYQKGDWGAAKSVFASLAARDPASAHMARRCELPVGERLKPEWDGVWNFDHK